MHIPLFSSDTMDLRIDNIDIVSVSQSVSTVPLNLTITTVLVGPLGLPEASGQDTNYDISVYLYDAIDAMEGNLVIFDTSSLPELRQALLPSSADPDSRMSTVHTHTITTDFTIPTERKYCGRSWLV